MLTLSLEAASQTIYFALKGDNLLLSCSVINTNRKDGFLLSEIDKLLKYASSSINDVSLLVLGEGPGSFTSLRIASSLFKGFSLSCDIPIKSVSTLDTLSCSFDAIVDENTIVCPLIDARMNRFYTAFYKNKKRLSDDMDIAFEDILKKFPNDRILFVTHPNERENVKKLLPFSVFDAQKDRLVLLPSFYCFNPAISLIELAKDKEVDLDGKGPKYVREHSGLIKY